MLLEKGARWSDPSMTATGYYQMKGYISGEKQLEESVKDWIISEVQYAKRQLTWFKKDKRVNWFDISEKEYEKAIEKVIMRWYLRSNDVSKKN